jgi:hypothetical protein
MSHKTVYICDRCESYIGEKSRATITISISIPSGTLYAVENGGYEATRKLKKDAVGRELCMSCVREVVKQFNLDVEDPSDRLFKNFTLPGASTTSYLDVDDHEYDDFE